MTLPRVRNEISGPIGPVKTARLLDRERCIEIFRRIHSPEIDFNEAAYGAG